ncbi:MAG: glycerol kinase GlpK [Polyangiaceae bacterium]|nr:glycerol kinase GlpK [Polyangiaceae bacterium]
MAQHLLAIDQGTTGSTALVLGLDGRTLGRATCEFPQHFPNPGEVEHEPEEIWQSVVSSMGEALRVAQIKGADIAAIGITNQRETTLLWERASGKPLQRAIVWQDRRTSGWCDELRARGELARVRATTGLVLDPYFSATKIRWILDHVSGARGRAEAGELAFGTVDSYLVYRLAGGAVANAPHVTDVTNASRTSLMNLAAREWDRSMCELFQVPMAVLPRIVPNAAPIARTLGVPGLPDGIPVSGMAGDQHAALFGQGCFESGQVKCTYGTGAFVLMNTGSAPTVSHHGLLSTLAWQLSEVPVYALEGSCFVAGAAIQWLRDGLGIIGSAAEVEALAASVPDNGGVTFVPALAGLGAPHWDADARGMISGITRGTGRGHLARATLEGLALQVHELLAAMSQDLGAPIQTLRVDGGASQNNLLMQLQADIAQVSVERPRELETTARGAAMLAGIGAGLFSGPEDAARLLVVDRRFEPSLAAEARQKLLAQWGRAILRTSERGERID